MVILLDILIWYWTFSMLGGFIYVLVNWKWDWKEDKKGWLVFDYISDCIFILFLCPFYVVPRYVILVLIALAKTFL